MAGFYSGNEYRTRDLGGTENSNLAQLVGEIGIRFPRALKKYWLVFAVGFVLGNVVNVRQKSPLETSLERVNNGARSFIQRQAHEQANHFQIGGRN